jgi:hypothetical protein
LGQEVHAGLPKAHQQSCHEQQQSGLVSGLNNKQKIVTHQKKGAKKSVDIGLNMV